MPDKLTPAMIRAGEKAAAGLGEGVPWSQIVAAIYRAMAAAAPETCEKNAPPIKVQQTKPVGGKGPRGCAIPPDEEVKGSCAVGQ